MNLVGFTQSDVTFNFLLSIATTRALADYAAMLIDLKNSLHVQESHVIVMGASYGGS